MTRVDWLLTVLCGAWLLALLWIVAMSSGPFIEAVGAESTAEWVAAIGTISAVLVALGLAVWEFRRSNAALRRSRRESERGAVLNTLVLVTALLARVAHCCQAARQDLSRGSSVYTLAAQIRGSVDRLRHTNYADLPSNTFVHPLLTVTSQGDVAIGLLELFASWKSKVPEDAFDDVYSRIAADHARLVSLAHAAGVHWRGHKFSGDISVDIHLWKASS